MEVKIISHTNVDELEKIKNIKSYMNEIQSFLNQNDPLFSFSIQNNLMDYFELNNFYCLLIYLPSSNNEHYAKIFVSNKSQNNLFSFLDKNIPFFENSSKKILSYQKLENQIPQATEQRKIFKI